MISNDSAKNYHHLTANIKPTKFINEKQCDYHHKNFDNIQILKHSRRKIPIRNTWIDWRLSMLSIDNLHYCSSPSKTSSSSSKTTKTNISYHPFRLLLLLLLIILDSSSLNNFVGCINIDQTNTNHTSQRHQSSLLSSSSLNISLSKNIELIENLLNDPILEDAIEKLKQAWHMIHNPNSNSSTSSTLISSSSITSTKIKSLKNNNSKNRSRRWTSVTKSSTIVDDDDMMPSDDPIVYEEKLKQQRSNMIQHEPTTTIATNLEPMKIYPSSSKEFILKMNMTCSRCSRDEQAKTLRIESIKMNILNKLNMERAPNVSLKMLPRIPPINSMLMKFQQMLNDDPSVILQQQQSGKTIQTKIVNGNEYFGPLSSYDPKSLYDEDEFFVNAEKSIVFAQTAPTDRIIDGDLRVQYFKFPSNILHSQVQKAYLWLYLKGSSNVKVNSYIVIYQVVKGPTPLSQFKTKRISNSTARKGGWVHIRVEKLISKWFENPNSNFGLVIHAYDSNGQQMSVIHNDDVSADSSLRPFMEIRVDSRQSTISSRRKRTIGLNCEDKSAEVRCCRYPLTVDFEQFGWDWIIAPKRYQANYCSGECPFVLMNQYPHTHLIQQINMNAIGPCCSPRKMSSISMLYMDGDYNVIYGIVPNMVVDRCGCS